MTITVRHVAVLTYPILAISIAACTGSAATPSTARSGGRGGGRGGDAGAVPVTTAIVSARDVPLDLAAIGNVEAFETVSIRSQVTGLVTAVAFHEGDFVKKGDHLFTIDPRPYQALLDQARATLTRDRALVVQSQAQLARDKAQSDYVALSGERNAKLAERGILSKDVAQQSQAETAANAAAVAADQAAIDSAKAQLVAQQSAVDDAALQLAYTVIRSPITGKTGNLTMKSGSLVTANSTELISVAQVEPVFVTFSVPAAHLTTIRGHETHDPLHVTATPQDEGSQPVDGLLTFIDNAVDPATDTIRLKGRFDNADHRLWPGQFARITLRLSTLRHATVVSSEAIQTGQDGPFVFVVKPDATVEQRAVTIAQRMNDDVVVGQGLAPGETVVVEGQLRLEPGSHIQAASDSSSDEGGGGQPGRGGRRGGRSAS